MEFPSSKAVMQRLTENENGRAMRLLQNGSIRLNIARQLNVSRAVKRRHPLRGKSVTFPVYWWRFHGLLMTDCDTLNCLTTFNRILRSCSIPVALLSYPPSNAAWLLFERQKLCQCRPVKFTGCNTDELWALQESCFTRLAINSGNTNYWDFMIFVSGPLTISCRSWVNLLSECH